MPAQAIATRARHLHPMTSTRGTPQCHSSLACTPFRRTPCATSVPSSSPADSPAIAGAPRITPRFVSSREATLTASATAAAACSVICSVDLTRTDSMSGAAHVRTPSPARRVQHTPQHHLRTIINARGVAEHGALIATSASPAARVKRRHGHCAHANRQAHITIIETCQTRWRSERTCN